MLFMNLKNVLGQPIKRRSRSAASGQVVIESIASLLIFTIMLAVIMTITMWLYLQQALVTSAREGARQASLNAELAGAATKSAGVGAVKAYVQNTVRSLTGQDIDPSQITVTGPTGATPGQRTVAVTLSMTLKNPLGVAALFDALGTSGAKFDNIPMSASATLRYEE
jgi:hypothetical protein